MEEAGGSRYWCHMCSQPVTPVMEIEMIKCPFCQSGFVEEIASANPPGNDNPLDLVLGAGSESDRTLSLWAPILLGMMGNGRRRPSRRVEFEGDDDGDVYDSIHRRHEGEMELDHVESVLRRRMSSATILQLLQGVRNGMPSDQSSRQTENERDEENMVLINPFNQTIVFRGSNNSTIPSQNHAPVGSLRDYLAGPGLDLLLQHLADNDPNRYGTPPAKKEAVEALITVKNDETLQCSVCLDDCEIGAEMKELPCKHKFHSGCILPWLEMHSSCPVCRYQLPCDESKLDSGMSRNNSIDISANASHGESLLGDDRNENWRRFSASLPWPFNLFSSSASQSSSGSSSLASSSVSSSAPHRRDENRYQE